MRASDECLALIRQFEGFAAQPYTCTSGFLTIGYGHVIRAGELFNAPITEDEADALLRTDVLTAERAVARLVKVTLAQCEYDALVSFTFNVGAGALTCSTLLRLLNSGDKQAAARQLLRWDYSRGKKQPGLTRRRQAEMALFMRQLPPSV